MCDGKCRLMELFREEKSESGLLGPAIGRAFNRMVEESESKPDPYAEWKALKPGRKVLRVPDKSVDTVKACGDNFIHFMGGTLASLGWLKKNAQILPEGPFSADKLKVGDWVWVELGKDEKGEMKQ